MYLAFLNMQIKMDIQYPYILTMNLTLIRLCLILVKCTAIEKSTTHDLERNLPTLLLFFTGFRNASVLKYC